MRNGLNLFFSFSFILVSLLASAKIDENKTYSSDGQNFKVQSILKQKDIIWGFDFLSDGRIIFTERSGAIKIFDPRNQSLITLKGTPAVWEKGQGGMLDVRVHPKIKDRIYFTYSEPVKNESMTAVGMTTLSQDSLTQFKKIFSGHKPSDETIHFGSRIEFDDKGFLFVSIGERNERDRSQHLGFHNGKIIRLKDDGTIPNDNPFSTNNRAKPEIWSYGHRNPQGLARHPTTGELWSAEMGPRGGDELNLIKPGANYGWPVITFGREYYGPKIGEGTSKEGMEQPIAHWVPSISPSGMTFYNGDAFPKWKGHAFLGTLSSTHLRRLVIEGNKVTKQEELLKDLSLRIRNVRSGPDGHLYISTDDGIIARLVPSP